MIMNQYHDADVQNQQLNSVSGKSVPLKRVGMISVILLLVITYTYGRSLTVLYGGIELLISGICYIKIVKNYRRIDNTIRSATMVVVAIAFFAGLINFQIKSTILITTSLLIPLFISVLEIDYIDCENAFRLTTIVSVVVMYFELNYATFGDFNSNTLGFTGFMGVSLGFVWIKTAKKKVIPLAVVLFGLITVSYSGSRNVAIVVLLCLILVLLPKKTFQNKAVFVLLCSFVLCYTVFSADIMKLLFSNSKLSAFLHEFVERYSDKTWEMEARIDFLNYIKDLISQSSIIEKIFGTGYLVRHGHNMFYQCIMEYGYFGTILLYVVFIRVFVMAYELIVACDDSIVWGCVIALFGNLLLQGADVYMIGAETYAVVPQVIMGIIINKYIRYKENLETADLTNEINSES